MNAATEWPNFSPTVEAETACLKLLREYAPALTRPENVEAHIQELLDLDSGIASRFEYCTPRMPAAARKKLLVSGCACGSEMIIARRYGFREIHGTEVVSDLIRICQQRFEGSEGLFPVEYDGTTLPYPDESFSSIASGHIIEHTPDPEAYLQEHLRVLERDGWMFLEFPDRYHRYELHTGVRSVEFLPSPLRDIALRFLASRMSPASRDHRHHYQVIRTTLKPISVRLIKRWISRAPGLRARVMHSYSPAPGYARLLIKRD